MKLAVLVCVIAIANAAFTWDSCGTKLDRLITSTVSVDGSLTAGSKVTVTSSGTTNLHVPLTSGAWQVRIYEDGEAKEVATDVGDLMSALKFDDDRNTTFTMIVSFTLPAKQASGRFNANLVATDQAKSDYLCLEVKYNFTSVEELVTPVADPFCLHQEDVVDHKCFEACAATQFAMKGITGASTCPASYNTVDKTQVILQCPDGVTSLRYCPDTALNVTVNTKGQAGARVMMKAMVADQYCLHQEDVVDHKCFEACAATQFAMKGITGASTCPASYNTVDKTQVILQCPDGVTSLRYCPDTALNVTVNTKGQAGVRLLMNTMAADPFCLHQEDVVDHKCFEACAATQFAMKGITGASTCPASYNTVDKTQVILQCPDGVTSLRYCPDTALNVTVNTKGQAGAQQVRGLDLGFAEYSLARSNAQCAKDSDCPSSYCQNGFCHGCFDACCLVDSDCTKKGMTYCQNDSTKTPPYFCHA